MNIAQLQSRIQGLIPQRDAAAGREKTALRKEIQALERQLDILRAWTAKDMGRALFQSDLGPYLTRPQCADIASYIGRVLIGRNLMMGHAVRLNLENGHHVVCTLEKV